MACDHPNLQNIPRSGPLRSYIRPPEGRLFVVAEGMNVVLKGTDEVDVPVVVEARVARSWGEGE
jgi:DNA polymerase I-like protein with 3'-5' exonuclease and polymerase domains